MNKTNKVLSSLLPYIALSALGSEGEFIEDQLRQTYEGRALLKPTKKCLLPSCEAKHTHNWWVLQWRTL